MWPLFVIVASVCHCCKEPVVLDVIFSRVSCMDKLFWIAA